VSGSFALFLLSLSYQIVVDINSRHLHAVWCTL